jgi:integrase
MAAKQAGSYYRVSGGGWGVRWYGPDRRRRHKSGFRSKSEARAWWEEAIRPELLGCRAAMPEITFGELCERYLRAHTAAVQPRTIRSLRERLKRPIAAFGDVPVRELEHQVAEIAAWRAGLPEGYRFAITLAFKQVLAAGVRWHYVTENPVAAVGPNPPPPVVEIEPFTSAEVEAIAVELRSVYGPLVIFAAESALRPEEWIAVRRVDVDRVKGVVRVERTIVDGEEKPYGKTVRSRRSVPLSSRALAALDELPAQLHSPLLFPAPQGGPIRLDNWRKREWIPTLYGAGVEYRRPYALRHSAISRWLAANVPIFDVSRYAGTSLGQIEKTYGHLVAGSIESTRGRLDAFREYEVNRLGVEQASAVEVDSGQ